VEGIGQNKAVQSYSTKPGQQSAKQQVNTEARQLKRKNKKMPVKIFTEEEKAAFAIAHPEKLKLSVNGQWDLNKV
jgi:hypothetical protein